MSRPAFVVPLLVVVALIPDLSVAQAPPVRERLGARGGAVLTSGSLNDSYGNGGNVVLFFTERLFQSLFFDVHIGAIYMGDLKNSDLDDAIFGQLGIVSEMRFLYFSVGPQYVQPVGERTTLYVAAGLGVYSVSVVLDDPGVQAFNFSDQHLGFNGGAGYMYRFTDNWSVELNLTLQHVRTSSGVDDLYYTFTEGGGPPTLVEANVGVMIDLR